MRTFQATLIIFMLLASQAVFGRQLAKGGRTFDVEDNWVTEYLRSGGDKSSVTGLVKPADWQINATFVDIAPRADLPEAFDWREVIGGLQPIKNQGECGSCWAFSVTAVLESIYTIAFPEQNIPDLAEQTLVSKCYRKGNCDGGFFSAFKYLKNRGLPNEAQDPYLDANSNCKSGLEPVADIYSWAYIGNRFRSPSTEQIQTAIMNYGPVSVDVNASFEAYASGVFNDCNNKVTDHMVTIEGWNNDGQYWIVRNSWGPDWGEDGYIRIRYTGDNGRKCNRIGDIAAFAVLNSKK